MGKFKANDRVMAKWPGSSLWFEGTVVDFNDIEYQIRFHDDAKSEYIVKYKDVKDVQGFSRKRSKSRGRSTSRGRTGKGRSPGRPSSKGRSPGRTAKARSPARPKRNEVENVIEKNVTVKKTVTSVTSIEPDIILLDEISKPSVRPRLTRGEVYTPRTSTPTRQSPRLANKEKNDIDGQVNNVKADSTDFTATKTASPGIGCKLHGLVCKTGSGVKSVVCALIPSLATIKALFSTILMLALPFILNESCTKSRCSVTEFPPLPKPAVYYDPRTIAVVGGYLASLLLLYFLPLGRVLKTHSGGTVRRNGWLAMVMLASVLPVLHYLKYDVVFLYSKFRQLHATMTAFAVIICLVAYFHASYASKDAKNPVGNTGLFLPDFFTGRVLNPSIGPLDLKFFIFRAGVIAWILLIEIIVLKSLVPVNGKVDYNITLLVACALQALYAVDWMLFEDTYLTTYECTRTGFGLFLVAGNLSMVFNVPIFSRIILNQRNDMEWYYLALIVALNLVGYIINRGANSQKHAFRTNPSDPALAHLESIPTAAGTRLLVSGWWGFVRHPNYLGDILVFTAWALLSGFKYALPWVLVGLDVLFLVGRTYEVEGACKKKYGTLWDSYTSRVRSRLIPKVF